jgi:phosphatidylinositol kinase/protein kinase (PI-3  family)
VEEHFPVIWGEPWALACERFRKASPFGNFASWKAIPIIVKGNDDLR